MKISDCNFFKSNFLTLGTLFICSSGVNLVVLQPSLANTVKQFSGAGIIKTGQTANNRVRKKNWRFILKRNTNNSKLYSIPSTPSIENNTPQETIAKEIHLVVKLEEKRVYVYQGDSLIKSYPVAIGKIGYETPQGSFNIFSKEVDPVFKNYKTGKIIPPGRSNPLGSRWIGVWTDGKIQIGFHGTNRPSSIGKAVSHGCIRMHDRDVMELYEKVQLGTIVKIEP